MSRGIFILQCLMFCLVSDARKILKYKYDTFIFQSSWVLEVWQCLFSSHHRRKTRPVRNARQRHCATGKSSSQWSEQWFPAAKFHPSSNAHCEDGLGNCHVVSYGNSQCLTSPFPPVLLSISWLFNYENSENINSFILYNCYGYLLCIYHDSHIQYVAL